MRVKIFLMTAALSACLLSMELKTDSIEFEKWDPSIEIWTKIDYSFSFEARGLNDLKVIAIAPHNMVWEPETLFDTSGSLTNFEPEIFELKNMLVSLPWYLSSSHNYTGGKIFIRLIAENKYYNPYPVLYSAIIDTVIEYEIIHGVGISAPRKKEAETITLNHRVRYYDIHGRIHKSLKGLARGIYIQKGIKAKKIIIK